MLTFIDGASRIGARVASATAVSAALEPLLQTLERVVWVQRHLYPPQAPRLARELAPCREAVAGPLHALEAQDWPEDLHFMRDRLVAAARQTVELVEAFVEASQSPEGPIGLYRALRRFSGVQETLYPLAPVFEPVSRWFLEPARRGDGAMERRPGGRAGGRRRCPGGASAGGRAAR